MPNDLARAITQAHRILDWQENLSSDEMPPEWMWPFDEELELWFEEVERQRKEKYGGGASESTENLLENEYAKGRR